MAKLVTGYILVLLLLLVPTVLNAQTPGDAMEKIRQASAKYKIGEASAETEEDARKAALENLMTQLRTTFSLEMKETEKVNNADYNFQSESQLRASSIMTVENLSTLVFQDKKGWHAMTYISNSDLAAAEKNRKENIKDLVELGVEQEGKLNISGALKYYTWALNMLSSFGDNLSMPLEGKNRNVKGWLKDHISMMLDNIEISINGNEIEYDEFDYDHYSINLNLLYAGQPVSALDLSYFNGEREVKPIHGKNGFATLLFPDITNFKDLDIKIVYDYPEEAKLYDPELKFVYESGARNRFEGRDHISLPLKLNSTKIKSSASARNDALTASAKASKKDVATLASSAGTSPIITDSKKQVERPVIEGAEALIESMKSVEKALKNRDYASVKPLFTDEGWSIFSLLTGSGDVRVVKSPQEYTVETCNLYTTGRGIPVAIKTAGHVSNETIVFRFDKATGLISSVAYALTKRAEEDIFRQAQWNMDSRYTLLKFMEDYQTAFALKRLDYIESIFSDQAVIITGKITPGPPSKQFFDAKGLYPNSSKNVTYRRHTKDQYIRQLKTDFFNKKASTYKKYIQLVFEDAVISKVATDGFTDNEIMWIEIQQQYTSNNYSDKGFLTLQINLNPKGSQILVRTWTPEFVNLELLKERYPVGDDGK